MRHRSPLCALTTPLLLTGLLVTGAALASPVSAATVPAITSFSPAAARLYNTVTITGSNFRSPATVRFNGVASTTTKVLSKYRISAVVPPTASTGKVSVRTAGRTVTSRAAFQVLAGSHLSVTSGPPTTQTTISVSGFAAYEVVDVTYGRQAVTALVADSHGYAGASVRVPVAAPPGAQLFVAAGRHSGRASAATFTVRTDVTHSGFDNAHTGNNPYENQLSTATVAKASQQWATKLPGSVNATPAVVGGVVYESVGDGTVRAFSAATGAQKWSHATAGGSMFSSPAVSGGVVFAGSGDHKLMALNAATGALKWSFTTGDVVYSSPLVVGTTVYFGSYDHYVYAVNSATGALRWKHLMGASVFASPTYAYGTLFVGDFAGNAEALNPATGALLWSTPGAGLVLAPVVAADGLVFVSGETKLQALDVGTGTVEWTKTSNSDAVAVDSGTLFVPDNYAVLTAYDAASGSVLWVRSLGAGALRQPPAVTNGVLYAGGDYTFAIRESDGALLRTFTAGGNYGGATIADGTITLGNNRKQTLVRYVLPASATG